MTDNNKLYGHIEFEQVVYYQLVKVGELSTRIFESGDTSEWLKNALNYYYSVKLLEALIYPYLSNNYFKQLKGIEDKGIKKYKARTEKDLFYDVKDIIETTNEIVKLIAQTLKKIGLLIPARISIKYGSELDMDMEEEEDGE